MLASVSVRVPQGVFSSSATSSLPSWLSIHLLRKGCPSKQFIMVIALNFVLLWFVTLFYPKLLSLCTLPPTSLFWKAKYSSRVINHKSKQSTHAPIATALILDSKNGSSSSSHQQVSPEDVSLSSMFDPLLFSLLLSFSCFQFNLSAMQIEYLLIANHSYIRS